MTIYEIIGFSLLFIGTLELFLGIILLRNNPRQSPVQKAVTALALFSAAFSLTSGFMYLRASLGLSIDLAARINWIGWFTVPAALQVLFFLKDDRGRFGRMIGIVLYPLWVVILGLCLFTDLIVAPGYSVIPFVNHYGPLEHAGRFFGTLLAFWLLYECVRLKKSMVGARKAQFNYFFYGLLIFGGGASFTAGFLQLLGGVAFEPGLAAFFSFPWVILTFYACIRYSLFDIRHHRLAHAHRHFPVHHRRADTSRHHNIPQPLSGGRSLQTSSRSRSSALFFMGHRSERAFRSGSRALLSKASMITSSS